MSRNKDRPNTVLLVSASKQFVTVIRNILPEKQCSGIDSCESASGARQKLLEKDYDIIVIDCPLPDEFGHELALDMSENRKSSILIAVPMEVYDTVSDHITDYGIFTITKPVSRAEAQKTLRLMAAVQSRIHALERQIASTVEKMEELRLVNKAKLLLMQNRKMSEDEAHRFIGKQAMDHGLSRRKIAEFLLEEL